MTFPKDRSILGRQFRSVPASSQSRDLWGGVVPLLISWKDAADTVESLTTAAALVVAGFWTYKTFIQQRLAQPRLQLTLAHKSVSLDSSRFMRVQATLRNLGSVSFTSTAAEVRVRQVVPLPAEVEQSLLAGYDPVPEGETQIEWPLLERRQWAWKPGEFEIEPGELDSLNAEFFLPTSTQTVEVHFFVSNPTKRRVGLGWAMSTVIDLRERGVTDGNEKWSAAPANTSAPHPGAAEAAETARSSDTTASEEAADTARSSGATDSE